MEILNSKISTDSIKINQFYAIENQLHTLLEEELIHVNRKSLHDSREKIFWINVFEAEIVKGPLRSQFDWPVYLVIQFGDLQFRTRVSENLRSPVWNEHFKM